MPDVQEKEKLEDDNDALADELPDDILSDGTGEPAAPGGKDDLDDFDV